MTEPTRLFFTRLSEQHQPMLESMTGTVRFDIADGERSVILQQVTNGLAVRMAALFLVNGGKGPQEIAA